MTTTEKRKPTRRGKRKVRIEAMKRAGPDHAVNTLVGGRPDLCRLEPCDTCPWRVDAVGEFPAEAFRIAASTSYDMARNMFACHSSGSVKPATCAGFVLRTHHNLALRFKVAEGQIDPDRISDGGHELHEDYRAMSIANGVDADDPVLWGCR